MHRYAPDDASTARLRANAAPCGRRVPRSAADRTTTLRAGCVAAAHRATHAVATSRVPSLLQSSYTTTSTPPL